MTGLRGRNSREGGGNDSTRDAKGIGNLRFCLCSPQSGRMRIDKVLGSKLASFARLAVRSPSRVPTGIDGTARFSCTPEMFSKWDLGLSVLISD